MPERNISWPPPAITTWECGRCHLVFQHTRVAGEMASYIPVVCPRCRWNEWDWRRVEARNTAYSAAFGQPEEDDL